MTDRAMQILVELHKECPDVSFRWEDQDWVFGDASHCTLTATLRSNPSKTKSMNCKDGIQKHHTIAELVDGFKTHLVSALRE